MTIYEVIRRPIITEKAMTQKENHRTLVFEVSPTANKTIIKSAVEALFKVKVETVHTASMTGKMRRRGKFAAYQSDWKKAYVKLRAGEKVPEYTDFQ